MSFLSILAVGYNINQALWLKHCLGDENYTYKGASIIIETASAYDAVHLMCKQPYHLVVLSYDYHEEDSDTPSAFDTLFDAIRYLYPAQKILILTKTGQKPTHKTDKGTRCLPELFRKNQAEKALRTLLNGTLENRLILTDSDLPEQVFRLRKTHF